jgi:hypothetical protein
VNDRVLMTKIARERKTALVAILARFLTAFIISAIRQKNGNKIHKI